MEIVKDFNNYGKKNIKLKIKRPNMVFKIKRINTKVKIKLSTYNFFKYLFNSFYNFIYKYGYFILTIFIMSIIFLFSNQVDVISAEVSNNVGGFLNKFFIFKFVFGIFPIRKLAHFTLYYCLSFCIYKSFRHLNFNYLKANILAIIISFLYACSDEIHQLFVIGRSGNFIDILIDMGGVIFCLICIKILNSFKNFLRNKNKEV